MFQYFRNVLIVKSAKRYESAKRRYSKKRSSHEERKRTKQKLNSNQTYSMVWFTDTWVLLTSNKNEEIYPKLLDIVITKHSRNGLVLYIHWTGELRINDRKNGIEVKVCVCVWWWWWTFKIRSLAKSADALYALNNVYTILCIERWAIKR